MEDVKKNRNLELDVIFGDGTRQQTSISPVAFDFVKRFAGTMPSLLEGTGLSQIVCSEKTIVAVSRRDHDISCYTSPERQAVYRLGQMDMQHSIADMLEAMADGTQGDVCSTLIDAAERVRKLEVTG